MNKHNGVPAALPTYEYEVKLHCARLKLALDRELYPSSGTLIKHAYRAGAPALQCALLIVTTFAAIDRSPCTPPDKKSAKDKDMIEKWDELGL